MKKIVVLMIGFLTIVSCNTENVPDPVLPLPTSQQLAWQELEYYGFLHFNMNTFTNIEWGYGDRTPDTFNPTELDARQWAKVAKEAGMKGLIITAKHHDGFCLWPTATTEHSVKNSKWKNGEGDVIREMSEACKEFGLKFGVYLSPWDRNNEHYGTEKYIDIFRTQLEELLTNYGDVFEVWFDGANGGDGYYGGANEVRKVDKKSYYDWEKTYKMVFDLQPDAIIFSDSGPGTRWVGNEHGHSWKTTWSPLLKDSVYGGMPDYNTKYAMGQENGTHWVPAEADVSIRPGWYYHESEDNKVHSLQKLLDIYYYSIGRNSNLLLNFPVDDRGLIHENDVKQLTKLTNQLKLDFEHELVKNKAVEASNIRGGNDAYAASNTVDGDANSYWTTDDDIVNASITIDLGAPTEFNRFVVQEYIALGQRVKKFSLEAEINGKWENIDNQTTIGYKRILRLDNVTATKVRLTIEDAKASPLISNIELYNAPLVVDAPEIIRSKSGLVSLDIPQEGVDVFYTIDGSDPSTDAMKFESSFKVDTPTTIKAFSVDALTGRTSETVERNLDISKKTWAVVNSPKAMESMKAIDDDLKTNYTTEKGVNEVIIALGKTESVKGFTYTPTQGRYVSRAITHYSFYGSTNRRNWVELSKGEFSNILANPIQQSVLFGNTSKVKFIKLVGDKIQNESNNITIGEIGLITE